MLCIIDIEVFHATRLVIAADEGLPFMVGDPQAEGLAFRVELVRIEVIALELAVQLQFRLEVCRTDSRPLVWEVFLELVEQCRARNSRVNLIV